MLSKKDRSNLAGEFYTLAELYRRGFNAFITLGKAKQIDIIIKENDKALLVEVKSRIAGGQFLCSSPENAMINKVWVFVDMFRKEEDEHPDFYIISASDLCAIHSERQKEIRTREKLRGHKYAPFSSLDVPMKQLKKYNQGWGLIKKKLGIN